MRVQYPVLPQFPKTCDRPRHRVIGWVIESKNYLQGILVHALPALRLVHGRADRKTLPGQKGFSVICAGVYYKRVPVPAPDGISHVIGIHICGNLSPVGPDFAPIVIILEVLQQPVSSEKNFKWSRSKKNSRHTKGIAIEHRTR